MSDKNSPERIWLQCDPDNNLYDTTWCKDKINDTDAEYILASVAAERYAEKDEEIKARIANREIDKEEIEYLKERCARLLELLNRWLGEVPPCICISAYKNRGLADPSCRRCDMDDELIEETRAALDKEERG